MGLYPEQVSVYPGDTLRLHMSFAAPTFRIDFFRHGAELAFQFSVSGRSPGNPPAPNPPTDTTNPVTYGDWNWPSVDVEIPPDAPPGVWFANLVEPGLAIAERGVRLPPPGLSPPPVPALYRDNDQALFVVKNPNPGSRTSILYKLPLLTYHAYNNSGGPDGKSGISL